MEEVGIKMLNKKSRMAKFRKSPLFYFICFCSLSMVGYLVFYAYPFFRTLFLSFTDKSIQTIGKPNFIFWQNYINIFMYEKLLGKAIINSFVYAFFSGLLTLVLALIAALLLNSKVKGVGIFRVVLFLPFVIPAFAAAAMFKGMFDPNNGIINMVLWKAFGIHGPGWFKSENTAMLTMILMSVWGFGVQMLIFLAALQNVPRELHEAVEIDGGGAWTKFRAVTMPMISPMLFLNIILVTISGLKSFTTGFLISSTTGDPNYSTLLFPVFIYKEAFEGSRRLGYASALAWIYFAIIMVVTIFQFVVSKFYVHKEKE